MAGDQDGRILSHADVHLRDLRLPVGRPVGLIQQGHGVHSVFSSLQHQGRQGFRPRVPVQGRRQGPLEEGVDVFIPHPQDTGVFQISGHAL